MPQVLYIAPGDPWDRWTNSGVTINIISRLRERGLLYGALSRHAPDLKELHRRSQLRTLWKKVHYRLFKPERPRLQDIAPGLNESTGHMAEVLGRLPAGSIVFYHYVVPIVDPSLSIKRYMFQDLTMDDGRAAKGFGIDTLSDDEFAMRRARLHRVLHEVDGICTFASFMVGALQKQHGVARDKVTAIGAGPIRPVPTRPNTELRRYRARRVLFVGRQFERKGGEILLEAFERVRRELPDATLTVVSSLAKFSPRAGVEHIEFASNKELEMLYTSASVFTMPSVCETWGLVYVEAAAHGLPIVNFDSWALPDIVDHGVTGLLTPVHSADGLAAALVEALHDPRRLQAMGRASVARVRDVLDWPHVMDRLYAMMLPGELAGRSPRWMRESV